MIINILNRVKRLGVFHTSSQIGLRVDSGIASIYDDTGVEIENAELLFTEEGLNLLYLFMYNIL